MSLMRFMDRGGVLRSFGIFGAVTLCAMIGCGNLGRGCFGRGSLVGDGDGDGVGSGDNCPDDANADQADADGDGVGNVCDNCPNFANVDQADRDADGVGDGCDNSPDEPNPGQGDADNDEVGNASDNCRDISNPDQDDADEDGRGDACDNCPGDANPDQADTNSNGVGDACEGDFDGDGVADEDDNCLTLSNADQADTDGDGVGDECDNSPEPNPDQSDDDGDGVGDLSDNCPNVANANQADGDLDGVGDVCDNCPGDANANQIDGNGDGVGDACEGDRDGDDVADDVDNCPAISNATQANADSDGLGDACDNCPQVANQDQADTDTDGDGNACDNCPTTANANQVNSDTDPLGDACDNCPFVSNPNQDNVCGGGGGPPPPTPDPVQVEAGPDQIVCPGDSVTLDATSIPAQPTASIAWSQVPPTSVGVNNAPDPVTFTAPVSPNGSVQDLNFTARGTQAGRADGTNDVKITVRSFALLGTKSSGAAQPGDEVVIDLAVGVPAAIVPNWVQNLSDPVRVELQPSGARGQKFRAPDVTTTTNLNFIAVANCPPNTAGDGVTAYAGSLVVPIQVATVELTLPDNVAEGGEPLNLYDYTEVNDALTDPQNLAARGLTLLFFASKPNDGGLPPGVIASVDLDTGILTVTSGAGQTLRIIARLFGTANELASDQDDILIVADGG